MARKYIVRLEDSGEEYYLEWSSAAGRPSGWGLPYAEFAEEYVRSRGVDSVARLSERMARVAVRGTSARFLWVGDLIATNRAGAGESRFSEAQIVEWYCRRKQEPTEEGEWGDEGGFDWGLLG